ncbi:MAG: N-acetylglucosamine-6-phosphate deacetylase [Verrucomicrobiota bacterium]|jgi:N-acetylglucosamine-6-phosphate deacetylase
MSRAEQDAGPAQGEIVARHHATGESLRVAWRDGVLTSVEAATASPGGRWIAPALVDLQVNGFAGVDFQQDALTLDQLVTAVAGLRAAGCARFLLTLVTDGWPQLMGRLRAIRRLRENSAMLQSAIVGWHVEGPFLSPLTGFCGAHDPKCMCDPTSDHIRELREVTGADLVLLTLAPERHGALNAIELASSLGIQVSLGHTDASTDILLRAIRAGAIAFTHLGNGCPRELDRHGNILWRVLDLPPHFHVSLIPDGIHVPPEFLRVVHRLRGASIFHVSDAMAAAGAPPGRHPLGRLELEVGADQIVRFPGGTQFAGSALRPIEGVFRAATMLQCGWQNAWKYFSEIPARLLLLPCELRAGAAANFCVIEEGEDPLSPDPSKVVTVSARAPTLSRWR